MADANNNVPPADEEPVVPPVDDVDEPEAPADEAAPDNGKSEDLGPRLERLGGEPAPDITPEEFARLQQAGQIHIDPRGRVRTAQRDETDAGISLRKRRAWYA
jgi:hypothetical protein